MKKIAIIAAGLAMLVSASGAQAFEARFTQAPAAAQTAAAYTQKVDWRGGYHRHGRRHHIGPRRVSRILHRHGYRDIRDIRQHRNVYIVRAVGRRGNLVRLVVSARDGDILDRRIIRRHHGGWGRHGHGDWHGHGTWR
ncbi:hypothetical protein GR183_10505 [Stappia sp. GBMRC 2046]|uniref:Peptidase propeptide and YPEB domain-containing protein n=1 Tax=Stappia sediminis TaxID=2692190 RepID=A0A7X3LUG1_9HYPH|nr:hypothetical protein [Stappia sediminis]MXN65331.1 hypothetical protein [Stappia sediminis]